MVLEWRPEDNLKELVLSFHHMGLNSGAFWAQAAGPAEPLTALLQNTWPEASTEDRKTCV